MFRKINKNDVGNNDFIQNYTNLDHKTVKNNTLILKNNQKLKLKFLAFAMFLMCFLFLMTGCASVNYSEYAGKGVYIIQINVDIKENELNGIINKETVALHLESCLASEYENTLKNYILGLNNCLINGEINQVELEALQNSFAPSYVCLKVGDIGGYYQLAIYETKVADKIFSIENIYNIYRFGSLNIPQGNENQNEQNSGEQIRDSLLFQVLEEKFTFNFGSSDIQYYSDLYLSTPGYAQDGYTLNDIDFSYSYCTEFRRLHSNCDELSFSNGLYEHKWNLEQDENGMPLSEEIMLYRNFLNYVNWYVVAIVFAILSVGVTALLLFIRHKNKSKKQIINFSTKNDNSNNNPPNEIIIE